MTLTPWQTVSLLDCLSVTVGINACEDSSRWTIPSNVDLRIPPIPIVGGRMFNPMPVTSHPCLAIVKRDLSSVGRDLGCWEVKEECHGVSWYPGKWLVLEWGYTTGIA